MGDGQKKQRDKKDDDDKEEQCEELDEALDQTFPASDPPAPIQPKAPVTEASLQTVV